MLPPEITASMRSEFQKASFSETKKFIPMLAKWESVMAPAVIMQHTKKYMQQHLNKPTSFYFEEKKDLIFSALEPHRVKNGENQSKSSTEVVIFNNPAKAK